MKWMWVVVAVILLLAAGGFGYYKLSNKAVNPAASTAPKQEEHASVFSSIQDAVMKSLSLQCDFSPNDSTHVLAYLKNGQVRSEVAVKNDPQASGNAIINIKDNKIYYWNAQNMGFMMMMPDTDVTVTPASGDSKTNSVQNMWQTMEQYKDHCKVANVDDSLFVLPKNITFQDMTKMMPTSSPTGSYGVPTQYQQYIQQYQHPQGQ